MNFRPSLVPLLLAGCVLGVYAAEPLVHLEAKGEAVENGKTLDMDFTEVERRPDASIVQVNLRSGGSVSSSLFVLRGMCALAKARGEPYFKSSRLPAPAGRYIVRFQQSAPAASDAAPAGDFFSLAQCERLGALAMSPP